MTNPKSQYSRVRPRDQPKKNGAYARVADALSAPVMGSRFVFPRRFDRIAATLLDGRATSGVSPAQAEWFFGPRLQFEIDPARLRRRISDYVVARDGIHWIGASFLDAADWSAAIELLHMSPVHREMSEIVAADLDFRRIRSYHGLTRGLAIGRPSRRNGVILDSIEAVDSYFRYCVDLIESMKRHGPVPRRHFSKMDRPLLKHWHIRSPALDHAERDVGVAINEDGELIRHLGGKHRTAVAQALMLPSMPVELRLVHVRWLAREVERTGLPPHRALGDALERLAEGSDLWARSQDALFPTGDIALDTPLNRR